MISGNCKYILLGAFTFILLFTSCNKEATIDRILFKETKNKVYKDIDEAKLSETIKTSLENATIELKNIKFITNYYEKNGYQANLIERFFPDEKIKLLADHLANASQHGLNPEYFEANEYLSLLASVNSKDSVATLEDAYQQVAQLELATADALLNYSSALEFGVINPNKVLQRYYIETKQADTSFLTEILNSSNLESLLDSIQPRSETYLALQKALQSNTASANENAQERNRALMVNLERERWQQDIDTTEMVYVNIPAFRLDVIKDGNSVMNMKVVVGTGRNNNGKATFTETKPIKDTPHSHETPVLASRIHSVQVNPYWNIPKSIAGKEILKLVQDDRYYLSNAGIDVLQDEKVIENPENIDWSAISPDNLPYRFRQRPGDENSLGKIKFLFKNNSSVYLHDTPAQAAFNREIRASSHGCVRVAEPLDLAKALFKEGDKFNTIKNDMESSKQEQAKDIALSPQTQVVLDYRTVEVKDNKLQFHPDVYGLDIVLYSYM